MQLSSPWHRDSSRRHINVRHLLILYTFVHIGISFQLAFSFAFSFSFLCSIGRSCMHGWPHVPSDNTSSADHRKVSTLPDKPVLPQPSGDLLVLENVLNCDKYFVLTFIETVGLYIREHEITTPELFWNRDAVTILRWTKKKLTAWSRPSKGLAPRGSCLSLIVSYNHTFFIFFFFYFIFSYFLHIAHLYIYFSFFLFIKKVNFFNWYIFYQS